MDEDLFIHAGLGVSIEIDASIGPTISHKACSILSKSGIGWKLRAHHLRAAGIGKRAAGIGRLQTLQTLHILQSLRTQVELVQQDVFEGSISPHLLLFISFLSMSVKTKNRLDAVFMAGHKRLEASSGFYHLNEDLLGSIACMTL
jgi:hypothetical protein